MIGIILIAVAFAITLFIYSLITSHPESKVKKHLEDALAMKDGEIRELEKQVGSLKARLGRAEFDHSTLQAGLEGAKKELEPTEKEVEEAKKNEAALKEEITKLKSFLERQTAELNAITTENEMLKDKLRAKEKEKESAQEQEPGKKKMLGPEDEGGLSHHI